VTETRWATAPGWSTAHAVQPPGGRGRWRTACGRTVMTDPEPAPEGTPRCGACANQVAGLQRGRPAVPRRQQ
jgi:ribosomal protein L34E